MRPILLDPEYAIAISNRGLAYNDLGQYQRAIEDGNEAIRLDPQDAVAFNNRGIAYYNLGLNERAIDDYDEAIRLDGGPATSARLATPVDVAIDSSGNI